MAETNTNQNQNEQEEKQSQNQNEPQNQPQNQPQPSNQNQSEENIRIANEENEALKKELLNEQINNALTFAALEIGVEPSRIPYVLKLAEKDGLVEDGKISSEKAKESLSALLEALPEFKSVQNGVSGFVRVGRSDPGDSNETSADAKLRKAFGLK